MADAPPPLVSVAPPPPSSTSAIGVATTATAAASGAGGAVPLNGRQRMAELLALVEREFDALWEENALLRQRLGLPLADTNTPPGSPHIMLRSAALLSLQQQAAQQTLSLPQAQPRSKFARPGLGGGKTGSSSLLPQPPSSALVTSATTGAALIAPSGSSTTATTAAIATTAPMPATAAAVTATTTTAAAAATAATTTIASSAASASAMAEGVRWDVTRELIGHRDGVWETTPCPWGAGLFATASVDHSVRVWSSDEGQCLLVYYGHRGSVNSVRVNAQERLFCTASGDRTCHVFRMADLATASKRPTAAAASSAAAAAVRRSWTPLLDTQVALAGVGVVDGAQQGIGGDDALMHGHLGDATSPADSPRVLARELDQPVCVRSPLLEFKGHRGVVIAADWVAGSDRVVSASWDKTARLWSAATGEQLLQIATGGNGERCHPTNITTHPSAPLAVFAVSDGAFRVWDLRTKHVVLDSIQAATDSCLSAVFDPVDGDTIVTCSADRHIKVWDIRSSSKNPKYDVRGGVAVGRFNIPRSKLLIVPQDDGAHIVDFAGKRQGKLRKRTRSSILTTTMWTPDENTIISATFGGIITAWGKVAPLSSLS